MKQLSIIILVMGLFSWTGLFGQAKQTKESEYIDINKPVENPELKKSFVTFLTDKTEKNLENVINGLKKANFLVLVYTDEMKITTEGQDDKAVIDKGSKIKFINIFDTNNKPFLPIFTDWKEVDLWLKTRDSHTKSFVMTTFEVFEWIANDKFYNGVVINPGSVIWTLSSEKVRNFLNDFKKKN